MVNCKGNATLITSKHINCGTGFDMFEELSKWPAISSLTEIKIWIYKLNMARI